MKLLIPLLLIFTSLSLSAEQHAKSIVRLNKSFFQLASAKAKSIIESVIPEISIPPINVTTENGVHFHTLSMNLTQFDFPRTSFSISKDGLNWNTSGGKIEIKIHFVAQYANSGGPTLTKDGLATITAKDLRSNINSLIRTVDSRPQLITSKCSAGVKMLNVVFDADILDWVAKSLRHLIIGYMKDFVSVSTCNLVNGLTEQANSFVRNQPEEIHIWKNVYLNYTATKDPIFHDDFIDAECLFRIAIGDNETSIAEIDDDSFSDAILDSMKRSDHAAFTPTIAAGPAYFLGSVVTVLKDIILYALAAYGIFCIIRNLRKMLIRRRRTPQFPAPRAKTSDNETLVTSDR